MIAPVDRALCLAGGLCGAAGVAFSAIATHSGGGTMQTGASFLLMHAPAFLAVGLFASKPIRLAAWCLFIGVALFLAAPTGGSLMILGWIAIAITSLLPRRA